MTYCQYLSKSEEKRRKKGDRRVLLKLKNDLPSLQTN